METRIEKALSQAIAEAIAIINEKFPEAKRKNPDKETLFKSLKAMVFENLNTDDIPATDDEGRDSLHRDLDFSISAYIIKTIDDSFE
jgi:hypothetical protein